MSNKMKEKISGLIGCVIVQVEQANIDGESWPILLVKNSDDQIFQMEISSDPEGNGPGHIFLGLLSGENYDTYTEIVDENGWKAVAKMA